MLVNQFYGFRPSAFSRRKMDFGAEAAFKRGEPTAHHDRAARALEHLGNLCYDVSKPKKDYWCPRTFFINHSMVQRLGAYHFLALFCHE